MALVVITIRDVADRFRGFLSSVMLEASPNMFVSPTMNPRVRERVWAVVRDWHQQERRGSLVMVWRDLSAVGGVGIANLGDPPRELVEVDGMWLVRRRASKFDGTAP